MNVNNNIIDRRRTWDNRKEIIKGLLEQLDNIGNGSRLDYKTDKTQQEDTFVVELEEEQCQT